MFRFEHPGFFWLMALPLLLIAMVWLRKWAAGKNWSRWGSESSNSRIIAALPRSRFGWMSIAGIVLLSMAATNPQWGFRKVAVESKSAQIYLVLDISNSMLAEDIAPNRLERAKRLALDLSNAFRTDKVGLILFAGNAYMQSPLTTDWHAIQLFLNAANPDQAGTQGTAIGDAIRLAMKSQGEEEAGQGALLVLTDGEDHDSDAPSAIEEATAAGWATYLIGVGTEAGGTIPVSLDGTRDVKRDENGQPVMTALNEPLMKELVQKGNGRYFHINQGVSIIDDLKGELAALGRTQMEKRSFSEHKSFFQYFLFPGLLLILVPLMVNYKFDLL